jgi:immunoglobulin-binding protein 1
MDGQRSIGSVLSEAMAMVQDKIRDTSLASGSPEFQGLVREALRLLLQCQVYVLRGEVFSANETLEEFSAERLRFVLVPFLLAEVEQLVQDDKRHAHILRSKTQLTQFMDQVERLGLLGEGDKKTWKRGGKPPQDPAARRDEKLERGRREMANKKRLREINAKMKENEAKGADSDVGIDEELFRESVLLEIQVAVKNSLEWIDLIDQELPLAEKMEHHRKLEQASAGKMWAEPKREEKPPTPNPIKIELPPGYTQTPGPGGTVTIDKARQLPQGLLPAVAGTQREAFERQVFRPGFNMATMSVEEAGERDYQELLERTEREKAAAALRAEEPDEDDATHYDRVTVYKDRDWDAFKDDNVRSVFCLLLSLNSFAADWMWQHHWQSGMIRTYAHYCSLCVPQSVGISVAVVDDSLAKALGPGEHHRLDLGLPRPQVCLVNRLGEEPQPHVHEFGHDHKDVLVHVAYEAALLHHPSEEPITAKLLHQVRVQTEHREVYRCRAKLLHERLLLWLCHVSTTHKNQHGDCDALAASKWRWHQHYAAESLQRLRLWHATPSTHRHSPPLRERRAPAGKRSASETRKLLLQALR